MTFLNDKLFLNNVKVNIVLSHTFGPRKELHILRLEFYVRQQNQSTQFSDFKAKIVNVNLRILILKTKKSRSLINIAMMIIIFSEVETENKNAYHHN